MDTCEGTTTCGKPNPLPSDIHRLAADSIVSDGATYNYPQTAMSWFFCVTPPSLSQSTGQGSLVIDQVVSLNALDVNCHSGACQDEAVWTDSTAKQTTENEMLQKCVPNR